MNQMLRSCALATLALILPEELRAQAFDVAGTRAQGMGGAFVGVADDASAVYWNPGGLASGAYFSLVLDRAGAEATPKDGSAASRSSWLLALSAPVVGLTYYRLRHTTAIPVAPTGDDGPAGARLESLVTHHAGATLVQSLTDGIAVGATVKLVRGIATAGEAPGAVPESLLESAEDLMGRASNRFDVDIGIMTIGSFGRAGLVVRNLAAPGFESSGGEKLKLKRQARAGVAVSLTSSWLLAADLDLTKNDGAFGPDRAFAVGAEGRILPRAFARAGVRLNTTGDRGRQAAVTLGGSYAATGSLLLDGHVIAGSDDAPKGWGIAGRIVF